LINLPDADSLNVQRSDPPLIGITVDNRDNTAASGKYESSIAYSRAIVKAGGLPMLLPHEPGLATVTISRLDGLVLTGGVDPDTTHFGDAMHEKARPIDARRQAFELALLDASALRPELPVLGVCLGMQLMALHAGGRLNQYLPDTLDNPSAHQNDNRHTLRIVQDDSILHQLIDTQPTPQSPTPNPHHNTVVSYHQQAVADAGAMRVIATASDGVIEAIDAPTTDRPFYLGVQWHPERGGDGPFNGALFERFVRACRSRSFPPTVPFGQPTTSARA